MESESAFVSKENVAEANRQGIMTFEEYAERQHNTPYVFEVAAGDKKLVYFGAAHSREATDPMFEQIEQKFLEVNPQIVFTEGMNLLAQRKQQISERLKEVDRAAVINKMGERGFTLKLAVEAGIDFESPEPDFKNEIKYITEQGLGREEIFAYYMYRTVENYHRTPDNPPIEECLEPEIREFLECSNWQGFDYSIGHLQQIGARIWGERGDLSRKDYSRIDPVPWESKREHWTEVNRVSQQSNYFRDRYIVQRAAEIMKEKDRLFMVFGASHAYMQEPALRKIFEGQTR